MGPLSRRAVLASAAVPLLAASAAAQDAFPTPRPAATPAGLNVEPNVVYGEAGGEELLLDIYRTAGWPSPQPAVLLFHGGGLVTGSRGLVYGDARFLAEAGYVAFAVGYRLFDQVSGANPWPAQLDDAQRAVRWVRANAEQLGVDPNRVGAFGHSSGGTLAAALGVRDTRDDSDPALAGIPSRVQCVGDLSGDMDLTIPYPNTMWSDINAAMLGGTPEEVPDAYRDASPLYQVDTRSAPFLVLHGAIDDETPVEHSRRLVAALQAAEVEVIYGQFPTLGHLQTATWRFHAPFTLAFLARHLAPGT
jgi:acetyl esterase/lipase